MTGKPYCFDTCAQQTKKNRIAWAPTYLTKTGLLESPKRCHFRITDGRMQERSLEPDGIDTTNLIKYVIADKPSLAEKRPSVLNKR